MKIWSRVLVVREMLDLRVLGVHMRRNSRVATTIMRKGGIELGALLASSLRCMARAPLDLVRRAALFPPRALLGEPIIHDEGASHCHVEGLVLRRGQRDVPVARADDALGQARVLRAEDVDGALRVIKFLERLSTHLNGDPHCAKWLRRAEGVPIVVADERDATPGLGGVGRLAQRP